MERLFTEREWRAIAELERLSEWDGYPGFDFEKRLYGPAFAVGEFYLRRRGEFIPSYGLWLTWMGPPKPTYWVYEKTAEMQTTWCFAARVEAIADARGRLTNCPPDFLASMLARGRQRVAEKNAAHEAREAIAKAKEAAKAAKKVGRRRKAIFAAADGKCHYCATQLELAGDWHVDHKMPKALGGSNEPVNLVAACAPCNRAKKDKTDVEFFQLIGSRSARAKPAPQEG